MAEVQGLVNELATKLRKRKVEGSRETARLTAELFRTVISQQRVTSAALVEVVRDIGQQLIAANPVDGDGAITIKEFEQICGGSSDPINRIFQDVDKNGDGSLDFEESVTLCYCLVNERTIGCDGCDAPFIKGLYFTCVDCFDHNQTTTFDLCTSCYSSRNYVHHHSNFLDNYALLRSKAAYNNSESTNQGVRVESINSGFTNQPVSRSGSRRNGVFKAVNTGINVVNASIDIANVVDIASSCSIM